MINKQSSIPIYYQLAELIRERLAAGEYVPGDMLPSEREFSDRYDISRMTVRQAITSLVNEGILHRKKGTGTFVSAPKINQTLGGLTSFSEDMKARGLTPSNKLLRFEKVLCTRKDIRDILNLTEEDYVYEIERVRLADNQPMAIESIWLNARFVPDLHRDIVQSSLYDYLEKEAGLVIGEATQMLEASIISFEEAELLKVNKDAPVLMIERHTYLQEGTPLEVVRSRYRADRYRFSVDLPRLR
ncbi:GntR family transcriptional regulator [Alkalicoccus daliensis]|uniref:Transcriptional regulator, GntR family n=1 Tax=Alkalicoccus daliensis TaxID=745820 RepID=A0A1H0EUD8_9BACI|nr:GntR family transcriptional regulator [Alkalicoccus daliensis]SDN85943.1 transcriptional regulator, GntR family [Alkalicoccus daliensis]